MNPVMFIAIPLLVAFLATLLRKIPLFKSGWLPVAVLFASTLYAALMLPQVVANPINETIVIAAPLGINLYAGPLAISLILFTSLFGMVILSSSKMRELLSDGDAPSVITILHFAGLNGLFLSGDLFNIFVFLEIASLSAYAITALSDSTKSLEASIKYILAGSIASIALLVGIALVYFHTGTLNLAELSTLSSSIPASVKSLMVISLLIALLIEAEIFPFNTWVPDVYEGSGAEVSGMFSSMTLKATLYVLFRVVVTLTVSDSIRDLVLWIGLISMVVAELGALKQKNLVRMFAYSSMAQAGFMVAAFMARAEGDTIFYMYTHSAIKAGIFLILSLVAGSGKLDSLKGIGRKNPIIGLSAIVLVLALLGLPPFSGFVGKIMMLKGLMGSVGSLGVIIVLVASLIEAWYLLKLISIMYSPDIDDAKSISVIESLPLLIPVLFVTVVGIYPKVVHSYSSAASKDISTVEIYQNNVLENGVER